LRSEHSFVWSYQLLWNLKVHYRDHKKAPMISIVNIVNQMNRHILYL